MATTRTKKKPAQKPAPAPGRDYAREQQTRTTSRQLATRLTPEEGELLDRLVEALDAPIKSCLMAAVRAALVTLEGGKKGGNFIAVRRELMSHLDPAPKGPRPAGE